MTDGLTGLTIAALCHQVAQRYPDHTALVDGTSRTSFAELDKRTDQLCNALRAEGVGRGDRVAALLPDGLSIVELALAAAKAGAIFLPLNWRLAPPELAYIAGNARPSMWFVANEFSALASNTGLDLPTVGVPERIDGVPSRPYAEFLAASQDHDHLTSGPQASDPWIMLYTSGTTGRPKGCLLGHAGQYVTTMASVARWQTSEQDCAFSTLPLFHVAGLGILMLHLAAGATTVIAPRYADAETMLKIISEERCTALTVAPSQLLLLLEAQRALRLPLNLRLTTMGGGMHSPDLIEDVQKTMGTGVLAGYGQTEAGNFVAYMSGEEQVANPTASGRVLMHLETRVVDDQDQEVPLGETGELCLRGPSVLLGYWENPAASAEALRGGWLHTGDFVKLDRLGLIHFAGRKKELIKSGGENVYPRELELVLLAHPKIADCTIFGIPDPKWDEAVKAVIVLEPEQILNPEEIVSWCRQHIAGYKRPRYIEFLDAIPRTNLGKVATAELRARPIETHQKID